MGVQKHIYEKDYIWNPATCSCKNGKYLASITDDSVIMCDEIIDAEKTKTFAANVVKQTISIFYLHFH